jgi:hypothetical protein
VIRKERPISWRNCIPYDIRFTSTTCVDRDHIQDIDDTPEAELVFSKLRAALCQSYQSTTASHQLVHIIKSGDFGTTDSRMLSLSQDQFVVKKEE